MKKKVFITQNFSETQKVGENLGKSLKKGVVIALYGELGSGKTTFIQGFAKGLGIKERIISPTYTIVRRHEVSSRYKASSIKYFYHIDLYRIEERDNPKELGIEELMSNSENIVAIEWAERMSKFLLKERIDIYFEYLDENKRKITVIY